MTDAMIEQETPPCALGIDTATLSALHDAALPLSEEHRLREHVATCAACQARLAAFDQIATALRGQRELDPGDHVWLGVQTRAADRPTRVATWLGRGRSAAAWRGLAAVASIALVVGLLATVLANGAGNRPGNGTTFKPTQPIPTEWVKPTFAPTATPAFPTPTLPPTSPALTAQQAWGPNAAIMTVNTQLDATHSFWATAISPDGATLLGVKLTVPGGNAMPSGEAGIFTLANRQFTSIGLSQTPFYAVGCRQTDGRYLLATYDSAPGTTGAAGHYYYYYTYDRSTGQLWQMGRRLELGGEPVGVDHGLVVLSSGSVANPATHSITPLPLPVPSGDQASVDAYTWPYIIYTVSPSNGAQGTSVTRAHDLETGQDVALPQVDAIGGGAMGIAGTTLFIAQTVTNNPPPGIGPYVTTLFEDDTFFTSSAPPRRLASYAGRLGAVANARLVNLSTADGGGGVWDRAEQRFVLLVPPPAYGYSTNLFNAVSLAGHFLAVMQPMDPNGGSDAQQVTIYDTDTLSTTPGT
jgi:hypothetical protein